MSKSELLGSVITVLSFLVTVGTLGAKLVSLLEKLKAGQSFLREELQEFRIDLEERTDRLDERLRTVERQAAESRVLPWRVPSVGSGVSRGREPSSRRPG